MHIAIVMDGNGRWALNKNKDRIKGHEKGAEVAREITMYCSKNKDIKELSLYAFSTENWKRPSYEIDFLMKLLERYLKNELEIYIKNDVRFKVIGDISRFSNSLKKAIKNLEEKTKHCSSLLHNLALNYGSQNEIIRAFKLLSDDNKEINEENLNSYLDCSSPVDVFIRTGGNVRVSNFMLWQISYAEMFFTKTLWPDFNLGEFQDIIKDFTHIERRFGGLNKY